MTVINFTATANAIIVNITGGESDRKRSYLSMSVVLSGDSIQFYEAGMYKQSVSFAQIGLIGASTPTSLGNAYDLLTALIGTL